MIQALQRMVGPFSIPAKVTPLTKMIPEQERDEFNDKVFNGIIRLTPEMIELINNGEPVYAVPKRSIDYIVSSQDLDDWESLLERLYHLLNNLNKIAGNIRKVNYYKIINLNFQDKVIQDRHNKLQEKLLDKTTEEVDPQSKMVDVKKIENLKKHLMALGFVAGGALSSLVTEDLSGLTTGSVHKKGASIAKMLMDRYGLTDVQAAAMVGNFIRESGLVPYNVENSSPYDAQEPLPPPFGTPRTGYGWAQWTGSRLNDFLQKFLGGGPNVRGKAANDGDNWKMLTYELDGPYNHVIQGLRSYNDVVQATIYAELEYEGASIKANDERINAARGVLKELRQKASGSIVLPELFKHHVIKFDTNNKTTMLSHFIVDKPTIIDMDNVREPLIIIPIGRPIGRSILRILFQRPFAMIEDRFYRTIQQQSSPYDDGVKQESVIKNNTITVPELSITDDTTENISNINPQSFFDYNQEQIFTQLPNVVDYMTDFDVEESKTYNDIFVSPVSLFETKKTNIDTITTKTNDIFDKDIIIFTQDIFVTEE
jgi:hypothetical protein